MSLATVLADTTARLTRAGVTSPAVDAEFLLAHVVGMSRGEVLAKVHQGFELTEAQAADLEALVVRREAREPLQHLLGSAPFMSFQVRVGPGFLCRGPKPSLLPSEQSRPRPPWQSVTAGFALWISAPVAVSWPLL